MIYLFPMVGFYPISHMGHYYDLSKYIPKDGEAFIGVSKLVGTSFNFYIRKDIFEKQWKDINIQIEEISSVGQILNMVYDRSKELTIIVGDDREDFGERIIKSLEKDKFPELKGKRFDKYSLIVADKRSSNLSGTNMRLAALNNNYDRFKEHLGDMFDEYEILYYMNLMKDDITNKKLKIIRK